MLIIEVIIYILIGITYNYLIYLGTESLYFELEGNIKEDKKFISFIIFSILGIVLSYILNEKKRKYYNKTVSNGFYLGGITMLFLSITKHWYNMSKSIKTFIVGILFYLLIRYCYKKKETKKEQFKYIIRE
jgi:putative flippase GtrA